MLFVEKPLGVIWLNAPRDGELITYSDKLYTVKYTTAKPLEGTFDEAGAKKR